MSVLSSRVAMKHRCTIERDAATGPDSWGQTGDPDWQTHLANQPCRAWTERASEPVDDDRTVTLEERRVAIARGTDVTENDRIAAITEADGTALFEGPMGIEGVLIFPDHLELILERIR